MAGDTRAKTIPFRRALVDEVYDALLSLIMDQDIDPGSRLSIDGLARELGVSPTPIREALSRLEAEGLVAREARKGYATVRVLDAAGLSELFELRLLLEPHAARLAARHAGRHEAEELSGHLDEMRTAAASGNAEATFQHYRQFAEEDAAFHHAIARASGNALLADAIVRLRAHIHLYRLYFRHGLAADTSDEHQNVLTAIATGREDDAEAAMRMHLERSRDRLLAQVGDADGARPQA